jgi:hypothetical protein
MTCRAPALAALAGLIAFLGPSPCAHGQPHQAPERNPFLDGTHAFRRILYDVSRKNLKPLQSADAIADPRSTLVIVLGNPAPLLDIEARFCIRYGTLNGTGISMFVSRGGALLIATDQKTAGLESSFGWIVRGEQVKVPAGSSLAYRNMAECPLIDAHLSAMPALFEPSLSVVRGQAPPKVASNLPSSLRRTGTPALPLLATLPETCHDERGTAGPWAFAAGGTLGAGRVLLMADHSVFINQMMLQTDNGNIDFGYRCADWLLTSSTGRRDEILFYDEGAVQSDFAIPLRQLPPPPLPPPDTLLGMLDETVHAMEQEGTFARMEDEDFFNGVVEDVMRSAPFWQGAPPEWKLWTILVVTVSVLLGLYGFVRLGSFRHRPDTSARSLATLVRQQAPAAALMDQRHEALLREGNLWEAARGLARQVLVSAGVALSSESRPPALLVRGPWLRRWRQHRLWQRLWRLATSLRPLRVSPRAFAHLAREMEALQAALADGSARPGRTTSDERYP